LLLTYIPDILNKLIESIFVVTYKTYNLKLDQAARELCKELRKRQTVAETIFWKHVRGRKFNSLKFYRQFPIFYETNYNESFFIVDFFCLDKRLVIEIDDMIHLKRAQQDANRSEILTNLGLDVVRIKNEEIEKNINEVLSKLASILDL